MNKSIASTSEKKRKSKIGTFFKIVGSEFKEIGTTFTKGTWFTKVSCFIPGLGQILRGQFARGIMFLLIEGGLLFYIFGVGMPYLQDFGTLGTETSGYNDYGVMTYGDNSFFILLYGLLTITAIFLVILFWRINLKQNKKVDDLLRENRMIPTNKQDLHSLIDSNFDKTLLALPVIGIFLFTVLPIMFMICIAFTNYDMDHTPPGKLFTWVGFDNFKEIFSFGGTGFGSTFFKVLAWTLIWAFFATFLNYFLGMALALLINKKGIKFKKMWRTILIVTIAVPQFVSLLYVGKMFAADGIVNTYLLKWGWISRAIPFWTNPTLAQVLVIIINLWVGIPYLVLIATGLLMNIPADLYESARIDGATNIQMFFKITLPYMLFVTGPFLLTQFIGNINNFNVIYLLTTGQPLSTKLSNNAGYTDLLVTWLYKMTVNSSNYKMAAVIGIMVFVVVAVVSLIVYNLMPSVKDEEEFQ
ncbi:sugar ABC transporter permease [Eubacterium sp.]|uniref:carbohydrate ABC transporter permease n=1 Tax=Eubacterium sp. TaxID=142586 RepID=UPI00258A2DB1|nr:sugar ABC transporter permease [Eubacterium sp.]MCR5368999.1 sugar ABC transporter permease [Eubacterium sp.]